MGSVLRAPAGVSLGYVLVKNVVCRYQKAQLMQRRKETCLQKPCQHWRREHAARLAHRSQGTVRRRSYCSPAGQQPGEWGVEHT